MLRAMLAPSSPYLPEFRNANHQLVFIALTAVHPLIINARLNLLQMLYVLFNS